ncbi:hypothetical protein Ahy_B09g098307 isoform B [Arachis hypogaea]|uniref:Uncharacterized protein n=1 Tax=Arachis hypogaea TaxID=3818 RepID=A0A444XR13_ARAHY|nr:hypothetical protein Ahy_B09g098307 isoform B [Arachis hypogaea]
MSALPTLKLKDRDVSLCPRCNAVYSGFETAKSFRTGTLIISVTHSGGIEVLLEVDILTFMAEPKGVQGVEDEEDDSHPKYL